jgi:hypothetical protein
MPASPRSGAISRPAMGRAGWTAVSLLVFLGLGALAGGIALVLRPDGSILQMPVSMLEGSVFPDYLVPGLILGGLFGIGSLVVAGMGLRHWPIAPFLAFAIGVGQMIWIVVELIVIKGISFLHPLYFGVGLAIAAASVAWGWPTLRGWWASRG